MEPTTVFPAECSMHLLTPKSVILIYPLLLMRMFSGLISRWMDFLTLWILCNPSKICIVLSLPSPWWWRFLPQRGITCQPGWVWWCSWEYPYPCTLSPVSPTHFWKSTYRTPPHARSTLRLGIPSNHWAVASFSRATLRWWTWPQRRTRCLLPCRWLVSLRLCCRCRVASIPGWAEGYL